VELGGTRGRRPAGAPSGCDENAAVISELRGRAVTYVEADDQPTRDALLGYGVSEWMAGALVELYQDYRRSARNGYAAQVTDTVIRLTGRPARSLRALLSEKPAAAAAG
jgi:hypothetical protein